MLKQSPRAWFAKLSTILLSYDFKKVAVDNYVFVRKSISGYTILAVYVDNILLTGNDIQGISVTKELLSKHFVIRDMGKPKYFLGIEFAYPRGKMVLSQRKYVLDLLKETGRLGCKPEKTPIESNPPFWDTTSTLLDDIG